MDTVPRIGEAFSMVTCTGASGNTPIRPVAACDTLSESLLCCNETLGVDIALEEVFTDRETDDGSWSSVSVRVISASIHETTTQATLDHFTGRALYMGGRT